MLFEGKLSEYKTNYNSVIMCSVFNSKYSEWINPVNKNWGRILADIVSGHNDLQLETLTSMGSIKFEHRSFFHKCVQSGWSVL